MRIVFFGTPEFAVPSLRALIAAGHSVVGVLCQPDRPAGRGQHLHAPPVKLVASEVGIPVSQPDKIRREEVYAQLRAWAPDLIVVIAYGKILPTAILDLPPLGCINVHASLLPKYRGAAPIQWAIYHGEAQTGVTVMRINERMDTGDILLQRATAIAAEETYAELQNRLADLGAQALIETVELLINDAVTPEAQVEAQATYAPLVKKEDGRIDWTLDATQLERMVRAFNPWPSAYCFLDDKRLQIHRARAGSGPAAAAGTVTALGEEIAVATGTGTLLALELQMEGRKRLPAAEIARSGLIKIGTRFD